MTNAGKRAGAGRKPGALTLRTRAIAEAAINSGELTPLEVMLKAMQHFAGQEQWVNAAAIAKDAAPYVHPRLSAIEMKTTVATHEAALAQLEQG